MGGRNKYLSYFSAKSTIFALLALIIIYIIVKVKLIEFEIKNTCNSIMSEKDILLVPSKYEPILKRTNNITKFSFYDSILFQKWFCFIRFSDGVITEREVAFFSD